VAFLSFFVRLQARREHPLISLDLFTRAETAAPYLSGLLLGTTIYGVDTFVPLFVQGARGGSAGAAGAVVTPLVLGWSISAAVAARYIVRLGFRRTARAGALLILAGFAALGLAAGLGAGIAWISLACGLVGLGLGPSSLSQVLVIQHVVPEERRGIATSLVPFSRTVGGSLGVGALGGILASGLHRRLGLEADSASHFLEGGAATSPGLRLAIERSLLPVFGVLFVLAALNLLFAARYREGTDGAS
jgi:MFS family permease